MSIKSIKSVSTVRRPPKLLSHTDSKINNAFINGIYYVHSLKKLKDFNLHHQQSGITSNIIYCDFQLKMSQFGYYYLYSFIEIDDSSVYDFELNSGELEIFKADDFKIGKLIACGNSCKITLDSGVYLLAISYKHQIDGAVDDDLVTYSNSPDVSLKYSSIGVAWPLNVRNIEQQVIPKTKCQLPISSLFTPTKNELKYLQVDNNSVSSMSSRAPQRRPMAPNKLKRRSSADPNEMRDILEYKEHLERQLHYYSSVYNINIDGKSYNPNVVYSTRNFV
eukprot:NODE_9_length_47730_cov_0.323718.p19 type:complete len:278 gc:universal NODE_9_length_47730_cov_0.323718:21412-22245(+)